MEKDTFYFPHDYSARNDPKLQKVLAELGHEGLSVFWCLVEMLYENNGRLELSECKSYAFALHTNSELITNLLNNYKLFCSDDQFFWSNSVVSRLKSREDKSEKARKSAEKRWYNANAMRTHSEGNAKEEREERKEEEKRGEREKISLSHFGVESVQLVVHETMQSNLYEGAERSYTRLAAILIATVKDGVVKTRNEWCKHFQKLTLQQK